MDGWVRLACLLACLPPETEHGAGLVGGRLG